MDTGTPSRSGDFTRRRGALVPPGWVAARLLLALVCLGLLWPPPVAAQRCGAPATPIHVIQGSGARSPLLGSVRTVEAVVTAAPVPAAGRPRGFFLQTEAGHDDGDPATSEGLFVFAPDRTEVTVGERVRVTGLVSEFHERTELSRVRRLSRCGHGALPPPAQLPLPPGRRLERLEGMRVELVGAVVLTAAPESGRGYLAVAADRLYQPTQLASPGPAATALAAENAKRRLLVDARALDQHGGQPLRAGARLAGLHGVLDQHDDAYLLRPTAALPQIAGNPRPPVPPAAAVGQLRVVAFNLENYFNGDGRGHGFPTARGARTLEEFRRQQQRITAALGPLAADIVAVMEVENDGFGRNSAIVALAQSLTAASGLPYEVVRPQRRRLGDDAITVGLLYRRDSVRPVGRPAVLDARADARFSARNRPSLAQTFEQRSDGERLTVVVNHFKSKASACADTGDPDRGDGQGHCNLTRTRAAQALAAWLREDPTASGDPDLLIVGDLNAYALEDPIQELTDAGYVDLIRRQLGERAYTFVYDGQAGYLDHSLASPALLPQVAAVRIWHINADEPAAAGWSAGPYRSSDHDPVIVDLRLGAYRERESGSRP